MYNGEIVSYQISERPVLIQVLSMLDKALKTGHIAKVASYIQIKDGSTSIASYQEALKNHAIIQSMSRKGNCLDNSVMENFFGLLKSELLYLEEFTSHEDFINKLRITCFIFGIYKAVVSLYILIN